MPEAKQTRTYPPEFSVVDGENSAVFSGPDGEQRAGIYAAALPKDDTAASAA